MRAAVVGLLAVLLAACGNETGDSPRPDPQPRSAELAQSPPLPPVPSLDWRRALWPEANFTSALLLAPDARVASDPGSLLLRPDYRRATPDKPEPGADISGVDAPGVTLGPGNGIDPLARRPADAHLPRLAIIIDDVGHGLAQGRRIIDLPAPVALAILPHTLAAERLATEARQAGKPVMLHLPMENQGGTDIGPGGLYAQMSEAEFRQVLAANLDSLPGAKGVNNHMGSRLTTLRPQMDWLMEALLKRGLFFVDSRTSAQTQAAAAAGAHGVPHVSRNVFLDNLRTPEHLNSAFDKAVARAREQGKAVLIGHPYPETLAFLEQRLVGLEAREGVRVVPVEALLERH